MHYDLSEHPHFQRRTDPQRGAESQPARTCQHALAAGACLAALCGAALSADDSGGYRGPARNGVFPATALMKQWPDGGPELVWRYENLGNGWSAVTVAGDTVYAVGGGSVGRLFAFTPDGRLKWRMRYGPEFSVRYQGCRSTPTVAGRNVLLASGLGVVYCLDAETGRTRWSVDTAEAFRCQVPGWGYNLTPLVVDGKVILPIRRGRSTMVALDVHTGRTVWENAPSEYAIGDTSPVLVEHGKCRLVVNNLWNGLIAVDPDTGRIVWKREGTAKAGTSLTPVFNEGYLLLDWDRKTVMLRPAADGKGFEELWSIDRIFSTAQAVILGGKVFAFGTLRLGEDRRRTGAMLCYDAGTGKLLKALATKGEPGSVVAADGMIYWQESGLRLTLARPTADGFEVVSSFEPGFGGEEMWIHPVIAGGRLFVRSDCAQGGDQARAAGKLAVYDLRADHAEPLHARRAKAAALVAKLASDRPADRLAAAEELVKMGWQARPATAALAKALSDPEAPVRKAAAAALGEIGPEAIAALLKALRTESVWAEGLAAKALVKASDAADLTAAVLDAAEGSAMVRDDALAVLTTMGPAAAPAVTKLLASDDRRVRWWALDVLMAYGPGAKPAVAELIRLLKEDNPWFRAKAAQTLGGIGVRDERVIAALRKAAEDKDEKVAKAAKDALGALQGK